MTINSGIPLGGRHKVRYQYQPRIIEQHNDISVVYPDVAIPDLVDVAWLKKYQDQLPSGTSITFPNKKFLIIK